MAARLPTADEASPHLLIPPSTASCPREAKNLPPHTFTAQMDSGDEEVLDLRSLVKTAPPPAPAPAPAAPPPPSSVPASSSAAVKLPPLVPAPSASASATSAPAQPPSDSQKAEKAEKKVGVWTLPWFFFLFMLPLRAGKHWPAPFLFISLLHWASLYYGVFLSHTMAYFSPLHASFQPLDEPLTGEEGQV